MNEIQNKLTEDKTVLLLIDYLKANGTQLKLLSWS